ncbi:MAG TPA: hypothetical protein V6D19_23905 [Stenomitos sp.]
MLKSCKQNFSWILDVYQLELAIELDIKYGVEDKSVSIRIKILKNLNKVGVYRSRVNRAELYRIQSTFPQKNGKPKHLPSDELIWVDDDFLWSYDDEILAPNSDSALEKVLEHINYKIGINEEVSFE